MGGDIPSIPGEYEITDGMAYEDGKEDITVIVHSQQHPIRN